MSDEELIEKLGGPTAVAARLGYGANGTQRVHNWKRRGIPARVLLDHAELFARGAQGAPAAPSDQPETPTQEPACAP